MYWTRDCAFQDGSYPCGYQDGGKLPDCELCYKIHRRDIKGFVELLDKEYSERYEGTSDDEVHRALRSIRWKVLQSLKQLVEE